MISILLWFIQIIGSFYGWPIHDLLIKNLIIHSELCLYIFYMYSLIITLHSKISKELCDRWWSECLFKSLNLTQILKLNKEVKDEKNSMIFRVHEWKAFHALLHHHEDYYMPPGEVWRGNVVHTIIFVRSVALPAIPSTHDIS